LASTNDAAGDPIAPRTLLKISVAAMLVALPVIYSLRNMLFGMPTNVYMATSGELVQSVVASGRVISPRWVPVALQGSGRVLHIAFAEGQAVERGQLLIELDNSDSRASAGSSQGDSLASKQNT
jgi:HlyD family secretion protein